MTSFETILFATDFSEGSEHAFDYAFSMAKTFGSRLLGLLKLASLQPDAFTAHDVFVPETHAWTAVPGRLDVNGMHLRGTD